MATAAYGGEQTCVHDSRLNGSTLQVREYAVTLGSGERKDLSFRLLGPVARSNGTECRPIVRRHR